MLSALLGVLGLAVAAVIVLLIRRDRLHVKHGIGWIAMAIVFAALGLAPSLVDMLATRLEIGYPPVLALTIAIPALVIKLLLVDIELSRLQVRNQRLAQELAISNCRLDELAGPTCKVDDSEELRLDE